MSNIGAYGSQLGLSERLREWSKRLRGSTEFPWQGTGLIADLEAAAEGLDSNDPTGFFSHNPATGEKLQAPQQEQEGADAPSTTLEWDI